MTSLIPGLTWAVTLLGRGWERAYHYNERFLACIAIGDLEPRDPITGAPLDDPPPAELLLMAGLIAHFQRKNVVVANIDEYWI